jgi:hypothetical protein|tara:strand:- start:591 stop:950 length:360 start_codon:yes stop_codon:yes gene_type:complete
MQKYKPGIDKKVKPKLQSDGSYRPGPFSDAQTALGKATFAKKERDEFFTEAYGDILSDLFIKWLNTEPHCTKEREYLYHVAMGLGSVKERLIQIETYGFNQEFIDQSHLEDEEQDNDSN